MLKKESLRKVDKLGRIVLPKDLRRRLGIEEGTDLFIGEEDGRIVLEVKSDLCPLCKEERENSSLPLCYACIRKIKAL